MSNHIPEAERTFIIHFPSLGYIAQGIHRKMLLAVEQEGLSNSLPTQLSNWIRWS